jgi:hypothetical protein
MTILIPAIIASVVASFLAGQLWRRHATRAEQSQDHRIAKAAACERAFRQGAAWQCGNDRRRMERVIRVAGERGAAVERARREMGAAR